MRGKRVECLNLSDVLIPRLPAGQNLRILGRNLIYAEHV